jgi:hypothetical protein
MKKNMIIAFGFSLLVISPVPALCDCTDLGQATNWYVSGDQGVIFYVQNNPLAKVVLQDCTLSASSNIRLLKSYVCDSDSLLVDGQECAIMSVTLGSTGSLQ